MDMKVLSNSYAVECTEQHMCGYCKLESNRLDKPHTVKKGKRIKHQLPVNFWTLSDTGK